MSNDETYWFGVPNSKLVDMIENGDRSPELVEEVLQRFVMAVDEMDVMAEEIVDLQTRLRQATRGLAA